MIQFGILRLVFKWSSSRQSKIILSIGWLAIWIVSMRWGSYASPLYCLHEAIQLGDSKDIAIAILIATPISMIVNIFWLFIGAYLLNELGRVKYLFK